MEYKMKIKLRTLKVDIFLFIVLFAGMFLILGINNDMAVTTLTEKISESNQQVLQFCVNRISVRLSQIEDYMFAYMVENPDMSVLRYDSENMAARVHVVNVCKLRRYQRIFYLYAGDRFPCNENMEIVGDLGYYGAASFYS